MHTDQSPQILQCGMYAFSPELRSAWTALFRNLHEYLPARFNAPVTVKFDHADDALKSPNLLLGHTCGYPFITRLKQSHQPVCVPEFDIAGCSGTDYSSWLVAGANHPGKCLNNFFDAVATFNARDSNSGMNVFRYEVSRIARGAPFFRQTLTSGSHLASINNLAQGHADIAAIDAVTWHFAKMHSRSETSKLKIIGQTIRTPGLPLVRPIDIQLDSSSFTQAINACLADAADSIRELLRIKRFSVINADAYSPILELEEFAVNNHYPELA